MKIDENFEEPFTTTIRENRGSSLIIPIPKQDVRSLNLKARQQVRVAIKKMDGVQMNEKKDLMKKIEKLEQENTELKETLEIMSDPSIMKRFRKESGRGQNKPLSDITKKYGLS